MIANLLQLRSALSAICLVLATAFVYETAAPPSSLPIPKPPPPVVTALPEASPPFTAPSRDSFAAVGDHPLFDPARKKYAPPPKPDPEKTAPPVPKVFVVGVIIDAETRIAMVKAPDAALATALTVGGQIAGWQISAIEPDRIVLKAGNSESEIRLDANKAAPVATPQHDTASTEQKNTP